MNKRCYECGRVFDLFEQSDAEEWFYGHDCEDVTAVEPNETITTGCVGIDA
jgi:hypothetical protein